MESIRSCRLLACLLLIAITAVAQADPPIAIVANRNLAPAGKLENGVLRLRLDIVNGVWRPEADDGPRLFVQAFAEAGGTAQIPGPMVRVPQGTMIEVTVSNKLKVTATVHGLHTRPGDPKNEDAFAIPPGETRVRRFPAGAPGTYYYWARTTPVRAVALLPPEPEPMDEDAQLNGAFIVDPPGAVSQDRVFVLNTMLVRPDVVQDGFEVVTINGKSYPFTEPLAYTAGDAIRWRVINPSFSVHPMHLHGAFFQLLSLGNAESDTPFAPGERQSVVTESLAPGGTMMMRWSPAHAGRWLFHCHFHFHMSADERVPELVRPVASVYEPAEAAVPGQPHSANAMAGMHAMAGLVLVISVKPRPGTPVSPVAVRPVKSLDLILEPKAESAGARPTFTCIVRDGSKVLTSGDRTVAPPSFLPATSPRRLRLSII